MQSALKRPTFIVLYLCVKIAVQVNSKSLLIQDINRFFSGEFRAAEANGIRVA
jgi:hypothetical protein